MTETLEVQLQKWQKTLLVFFGAGAVLFLTALSDFPSRMAALRQEGYTLIDGWFGLWFILLVACLTPGILLLLAPSWRKSQLEQRVPTGFGFLGVAWLVMLGFSLRMNVLLPPLGHFLIAASGPLLAAIYLLLRRNQPRKEEMFP